MNVYISFFDIINTWQFVKQEHWKEKKSFQVSNMNLKWALETQNLHV